MACSQLFFQRSGAVQMCPHDGRVDHRVIIVCILGQPFKELPPHSPFGAVTKPGIHHPKIAEPFRQIAPPTNPVGAARIAS
jgi:hypothetical protein